MIKINENYLKLRASYLFSEIGKRVAAYRNTKPGTTSGNTDKR